MVLSSSTEGLGILFPGKGPFRFPNGQYIILRCESAPLVCVIYKNKKILVEPL